MELLAVRPGGLYVDGTVGLGGHAAEILRRSAPDGRLLAFDKDPRPVITDPAAPYYGIKVDDRSLVPGPDARLGATTIDWWLANVPPPPKKQ